MGRLVPIEIENMVVAGGHCFARWPILVLRIMLFKNNIRGTFSENLQIPCQGQTNHTKFDNHFSTIFQSKRIYLARHTYTKLPTNTNFHDKLDLGVK